MRTEKEKMLAGDLYDAQDPQLSAERLRAKRVSKALNDLPPDRKDERLLLIRELIPDCGADPWIVPPFYCDYGSNIRLGDGVFFNFNCVVLDAAPVAIGHGVLFGPAVQIYTATHPLKASERRRGLELGKPIAIGDEAWIGGGSIICPGVTVGARSVIGAGSVVTKDIPADVVAAGNPCRVLRPLEPGEPWP